MPVADEQTCAPTLMMFGGQVIVQAAMPTVTVKEQVFTLPLASVTEQFTVVKPSGKLEPDAGAQLGAPTPEQLSATVNGG